MVSASQPAPVHPRAHTEVRAAVDLEVAALAARTCSGRFVRHALPHTTRARGEAVTFYDSNGSGVAAGDLDGDGDLDLVLGNLRGKSAILWNEGGLSFRREALEHGDTRAVAIVDVDGDDRLDIVLSQSLGALGYLHNEAGAFRRRALPGVLRKAYAFAWGDLDQDGDLDLVTASYDALLAKELRDGFLFSPQGGVAVYEHTPDGFVETRLAEHAQALAVTLFDVDGDDRLDIIVGNDFEVPDYVYLNRETGWVASAPFETTTRNTMSFDAGDIDNDGVPELFATDMKPRMRDTRVLAAWLPLMERSYQRKTRGQAQLEENALYKRTANDPTYHNLAYRLGLDATGWSWAGKFGDLDDDGRLDLYVVNGMIAKEIFAHLPDYALVEANEVFRNTPRGFERRPDWGLGALESGRGMTMADLDDDGDLDIVINNLEAPSTLFENQLCGGASVVLELRWPHSGNTRAIGARLTLTGANTRLTREVKLMSGYLSGDAARVHVGLPAPGPYRLRVIWPDGALSEVPEVAANTRVTLTRRDP